MKGGIYRRTRTHDQTKNWNIYPPNGLARRLSLALGLGTLLLAQAAANVWAQSSAAYSIVVSGLDNPRGLTFGPGDRLYVTETGHGGPGVDLIGYNGAVDEIVHPQSDHPALRTVVSGLPSWGSDGFFVGPAGISAQGNGNLHVIIGTGEWTGNPDFGKLLKVTTSGAVREVADVGHVGWEFTGAHPELDGGDGSPDTNPYGVVALPGRIFVVNAAANILNEILPNGQIKTLGYIQNDITAESSPTSLVQGPDGALYIGVEALNDSLTFGPSAKIYRVMPDQLPSGGEVPILGEAYEWATGLWPIHSLAFSPDGSLYVSEIITRTDFTGGDVVKIPFNDPSTHLSLTDQTLPFAGGVAVARDGTVYAVGNSAFAPSGFVARLARR